MKPTALVIGTGIGGIATAARLAKNGYDVTVLEKEAAPKGQETLYVLVPLGIWMLVPNRIGMPL